MLVPPLGGEGGVRTEFLIGKGAQRAVEAWEKDGTGREVWEKWRRGVWSGVVEAGEEGKGECWSTPLLWLG